MAKANDYLPPMQEIKCAMISVCVNIYEDDESFVEAELSVGFTKKEYADFIKKLDVEYDDGYGTQELHGTIWLKDGTWMERGEYDGSEWWNHQFCPEIPKELK
tara:strand:- start:526 stop:834 length:309 start_codon:yes stop_codon:yes gene_type:complete